MNKLFLFAALAVLVTGCTSSKQTGNTPAGNSKELAVSAAFSPDPPRRGDELLTLTVKDASGTAVTGAAVKITSAMPTMSMKGPTVSAQDNGDGTYSAHMRLTYATAWQFDISAVSNGRTGSARVKEDVQ